MVTLGPFAFVAAADDRGGSCLGNYGGACLSYNIDLDKPRSFMQIIQSRYIARAVRGGGTQTSLGDALQWSAPLQR